MLTFIQLEANLGIMIATILLTTLQHSTRLFRMDQGTRVVGDGVPMLGEATERVQRQSTKASSFSLVTHLVGKDDLWQENHYPVECRHIYTG